ncbi:DUF4395 domain-containing protein [Paenibacillus pini]|uniref:DUF4395 domain-containing protein n=1 Tax=Paenibacillus pini JCM 16418 TaxID=1236976 RepID=W7YXN1_9BACL|nr:DUF4395 domain-containing protein [Paenibacillus pini]GAF09436.1 hypothetical protein JCM16418_3577 [Paenibacillus pini JCM 16418]
MKEIPEPYVKANQAGIVLFVLLSALLNQPYILLVLWIIQVVGILTGKNVFVLIAKPAINVQGATTQALELQRFNNVLAIIFLSLSLLLFLAQLPILGYIFEAMLFLAAGAALCGYCIGCTIYFQYKQLKAKRMNKLKL